VIVLNGDPHEHDTGEPLVAVLESMGLEPNARGVAVALDGEIVPRAQWPTCPVPEGARVEVLTAMQGG
jgi:sulfur carrier protein